MKTLNLIYITILVLPGCLFAMNTEKVEFSHGTKPHYSCGKHRSHVYVLGDLECEKYDITPFNEHTECKYIKDSIEKIFTGNSKKTYKLLSQIYKGQEALKKLTENN